MNELEAEAICVIREVIARFERLALLISGGKSSIVVTHLSKKAFYPARIPLPLIPIDTGQNYRETLQVRDELARKKDRSVVYRIGTGE